MPWLKMPWSKNPDLQAQAEQEEAAANATRLAEETAQVEAYTKNWELEGIYLNLNPDWRLRDDHFTLKQLAMRFHKMHVRLQDGRCVHGTNVDLGLYGDPTWVPIVIVWRPKASTAK